ncbi:MAG: DUF4252 domain-containing protein [Muribaculaceae bacterium]|jgi:hypothetical protein|nr:DUF4252 domain-containing protein [Muribaculaceae bacterium]
MKKIFLLAIIATVCGLAASAMTFDELVEKYSKTEGVQIVEIDSTGMKVNGVSTPMGDAKQSITASHVAMMKAVSIEKPSKALSDNMVADMKTLRLEDEGYAPIVKNNEDGEHAYVYTKGTADRINSFVVVSVETDEIAIVKAVGDFTSEEMQNMVKVE